MLSRIPVHRLDALRPIISRYLAPTCSHRRLLSDSPAAATAAAKDRRWVMLSSDGRHRRPDDSSLVADANTVAESRTSKGRRLRVSFRCAAPPSSTYLYFDFPSSCNPYYDNYDCIKVVAAHGEFVLLKMSNSRSFSAAEDYFVYRPASARRPPSLSLLPVLEFSTKPESVPASYFDPPYRPRLDKGSIGMLRRGENDLLVVHVDLCYDEDARWKKAVFSVLRPGMRRWELMVPVSVQHGWSGGNVICISDRFLCWISYGSSFLLCDMADEASPKVRYIDLPLEVSLCSYGYDDSYVKVQRMGAAGDSSVRLVSIHPNCCRSVDPDRHLNSNDHHYYDDCCCREPRTECGDPRFVFTIKTWTMNLSTAEPLEWVEDEEIDGEEIWALLGYEGLPQAIPEWPVVCLDNVVCFTVSNYHFTKGVKKVWMVHLNIKTKTLLSVAQLDQCDRYPTEYYHLPAQFQY